MTLLADLPATWFLVILLAVSVGVWSAWGARSRGGLRSKAMPKSDPHSGGGGEADDPDEENAEWSESFQAIFRLRKELRAQAIESRTNPKIDLFELAESTLATEVGRELFAALREVLENQFPLESLVRTRPLRSEDAAVKQYDCPACQTFGVLGSLHLFQDGKRFQCLHCSASGDAYTYVLLAAPCYEFARKACDPCLDAALLFFTSAAMHQAAKRAFLDASMAHLGVRASPLQGRMAP
jgi:hypothetical protein